MVTPNTQQIKVKIEATLPLPQAQPAMLPPKPPCGNCGTCGKQKQPAKSPLAQVADILLKLAAGQYSPQQAEGIPEVIDALLRKQYSKQ
jgi:hypothetical protein